MDNSINSLENKLSELNSQLQNLNETISFLKSLQNETISNLSKENNNLTISHQANTEKIVNQKEQAKKLKMEVEANKIVISEFKIKIEELKKKKPKEINMQKSQILGNKEIDNILGTIFKGAFEKKNKDEINNELSKSLGGKIGKKNLIMQIEPNSISSAENSNDNDDSDDSNNDNNDNNDNDDNDDDSNNINKIVNMKQILNVLQQNNNLNQINQNIFKNIIPNSNFNNKNSQGKSISIYQKQIKIGIQQRIIKKEIIQNINENNNDQNNINLYEPYMQNLNENNNLINNDQDELGRISQILNKNIIPSNMLLPGGNDENKETQLVQRADLYKIKMEYERAFIKLRKLCNRNFQDITQQKLIRENYKQYLNEINQQLIYYDEKSNVSLINAEQMTININKEENLQNVYKQIDLISSDISILDEIFYSIKSIFRENIEFLLNEIQKDFVYLNKKQFENEFDFINNIKISGHHINEVSNICSTFEEFKDEFYKRNEIIEEEINSLNKQLNIINENNKNDDDDDNFSLFNYNENVNYGNIKLEDTFLIGFKNPVELELLRNKKQNKKINNEDDSKVAKLIRKNWQEKCSVYDDYDEHDITYEIKAVGLANNLYYPSASFGFNYHIEFEIKSFTVDGNPTNYVKKPHSIEFKIKLCNLNSSKIHIIYNEKKLLNKLSEGELEERKIYRYGDYGIERNMAGQNAKFSLIIKGNFEIANFSNYFLKKNKNNLNETEYIWEGIVPFEGKKTQIMFSKREAKWSFNIISKINSSQNISYTVLYKPMEFIGGNNEILSINTNSQQAKEINLDEEKRFYNIIYEDIETVGKFSISGELKNQCKGEWKVNLTDREIEDNIPIYDKYCKPQLANIAREIIEDFDRNNKNSDFEFLDYMKIGLWIHKNIKYDMNYIGEKEFTAIDTYYKRIGGSHHCTKLCNALLYSLGYKVIYVVGYLSKNNKQFSYETKHSWSLIQLNNKWYPFDSALGIVSGKLPVSHIFSTFFSLNIRRTGNDEITHEQTVNGSFIE